MSEQSPVEKCWDDFWKPIVTRDDGFLNIDAIKCELYDFKQMMNRFQHVVNHFGSTLGISKLTYEPEIYKEAIDLYVDQCVTDRIDEMIKILKEG